MTDTSDDILGQRVAQARAYVAKFPVAAKVWWLPDLLAKIAELEAKNREASAVLGLLRHHRTGPEWDSPLPSDLLSREHILLVDFENER